jgi:hypothetical protein
MKTLHACKARVKSPVRNGKPAKARNLLDKWAADVHYRDEHGVARATDAWWKGRAECPEVSVGDIIEVFFYNGKDGNRYCEVIDVEGL